MIPEHVPLHVHRVEQIPAKNPQVGIRGIGGTANNL
jgi:hypothetical protein